jgi:outer membrane receptor protein involved in Fe transport
MNQRGDVYSAYGQIDWALTERFNMNLGLRYTNDTKTGDTTVIAMFDTDTGLNTGTRLPEDFLYSRDFVLAHQDSFPTLCAPGVVPCSGPWKQVEQDFSKTAARSASTITSATTRWRTPVIRPASSQVHSTFAPRLCCWAPAICR